MNIESQAAAKDLGITKEQVVVPALLLFIIYSFVRFGQLLLKH